MSLPFTDVSCALVILTSNAQNLQDPFTSNHFVFLSGNWSEIYLSCSKDERVFADLSPSTASVSGLNVCKNEAQASGFSVGYDYLCPNGNCNYIYFQNLQDRPAGKYCHGYTSCNDFRFASLGGTHYQYNDNTRKEAYQYFDTFTQNVHEFNASGILYYFYNSLSIVLTIPLLLRSMDEKIFEMWRNGWRISIRLDVKWMQQFGSEFRTWVHVPQCEQWLQHHENLRLVSICIHRWTKLQIDWK